MKEVENSNLLIF